MKSRMLVVCCLFLFCISAKVRAQGKKIGRPSTTDCPNAFKNNGPSPKQLGPYLHWMEVKAGEHDEMDAVLQKVNALCVQNPEDQELAGWVQKFFDLSRKAQASDERTVNDSAGNPFSAGSTRKGNGAIPVETSMWIARYGPIRQ